MGSAGEDMRLKRQRVDLDVLHRIFALWGHAECMIMQTRYQNVIIAVEQYITKGKISKTAIARVLRDAEDTL